MGHERTGFIPKTKAWQAIIENLAKFSEDRNTTIQIADDTLNAIKRSYAQMPDNESVMKAIKFLSLLSHSATQENQVDYLKRNGCVVDDKLSFYSIANCALSSVSTDSGSLEVNKIARDALLQALSTYKQNHTSEQISLFDSNYQPVWGSIGNGAAFCELARSFFSSFTDRQLKYYIERTAASSIDDYSKLQKFSSGLSAQTETISHHAFETSKIMQSFAAGWFNNHSKNSLPTESEIFGFLRTSFGKLREEFRREAEGV